MSKNPFGLTVEVGESQEYRDPTETPREGEGEDEGIMENIDQRLFTQSEGAQQVKLRLLEKSRRVLTSYDADSQHFLDDFFEKKDRSERLSVHTRTWGKDKRGQKLAVQGSVFSFKEGETTRILKLYNYDCNTIIESKIVLEIVFQEYAKELNGTCGFFSPQIIRYGKIKLTREKMDDMDFHRKYLFYIVMENMPGVSIKQLLNKEDYPLFANYCKMIKKKIKDIIACLIKHTLFHNDLNSGNVFVLNPDDLENAEIGIIDFGEAGIAASDTVMLLFDCPKREFEPNISERTNSLESVADPWAFFQFEEDYSPEDRLHKKAKSLSNPYDYGGKRKKTMQKQISLNQKNISKKIKYRESKKHRTSQINHKIKRSKKHNKHYAKTLKINVKKQINNNKRSHSKKGVNKKIKY